MTSKRKLVTFKTDEKLWKDFKAVCGKTTATEAFISFMVRCVEQGALPSNQPTPEQHAALEQRVTTLETLVIQGQEQLSQLTQDINQLQSHLASDLSEK
ncbi:hypothetical protein PJF56_02200 [Roseofilum sp. BLCC_M91]|uniref:Plasmid segregation centromere-binding protein ParR n=1 Tax=Roseofilum halophilum BLCC-M91 TaxID=3022259 RepID=A0ABT7BFU0_9CYAN|nr:hypothetical protein [Roseofilum halophilum]MDJ1177667.1 hypothetical protein [Roseofilum halophilum BLCC-M91]